MLSRFNPYLYLMEVLLDPGVIFMALQAFLVIATTFTLCLIISIFLSLQKDLSNNQLMAGRECLISRHTHNISMLIQTLS
jgi:hypothetical protein